MTTQNKAVTVYLPKNVEDFITGYCNEYGITRRDKEGNTLPSLGTGIIELLRQLACNPDLVGSPLPDTVPSTISEAAIEKKIEDILEKKLSNLPDNVPSIEVLKDRLDNWVLAVDGDIKDVNQKIRDRSLQVDHQIASIKSRLEETMEQLLRLQQSASIANPPDLTSIDGSVEPANTSPLPTGEPVRPATAIETVPKIETLEDSLDNGLSVERDSLDNSPALEAIESLSTVETGEGMNAAQAYRYLAQKGVKVSEKTLSNWVNSKKIPMTDKGDKVSEYLILRDGRYFPDQG